MTMPAVPDRGRVRRRSRDPLSEDADDRSESGSFLVLGSHEGVGTLPSEHDLRATTRSRWPLVAWGIAQQSKEVAMNFKFNVVRSGCAAAALLAAVSGAAA